MEKDEEVLEHLIPLKDGVIDDDPDLDDDDDDDDDDEVVTMEAYIAKAPAPFRDVLTNALDVHNAQKKALIDTITANERNRFSKAFLATKGLQELQALAAFATPAGAGPSNDAAGGVPMFYGGAATLPGNPVMNMGEVTEVPLVAPAMTFADRP